ncbi:DUF1800 domain-containing protein [Muricoccus radiodurans]|uniref:DUF1800 domain-containing protein n=1 Tax=Muricoccus radiodurans TaxID=2231721 RepID=UPI003CF7F13E
MTAGIALRRFGLCGGPQDAARLGNDPRGALLAEVAEIARGPLPAPPDLLTSQSANDLFAARRDEARERRAERAARPRTDPTGAMEDRPSPARPGEAGMVEGMTPAARPPRSGLASIGDVQRQELAHLVGQAIVTRRPLEERLALFWTNHFTISAARQQVALHLGPFERDALRPRMLGRFDELLRAAVLHPAMLRYLDNTDSTGPNSPRGRGRGSVNENLAREVLELHSLGVDGGYTQADVTAFAGALSGWTAGVWQGRGPATGTLFDAQRHEPGPKTVLGRTYPDAGEDQAIAVLRDIAAHPSTARHITRRLATHFLGDGVPAAVPARLAAVWRDTGGDLRAVTEALLRLPESWSLPLVKLRSPLEFALAASRVTGVAPPVAPLLRDLGAMGQPVFRANSPKGWPDEDDAWIAPDGIKTRLDWSMNVAARLAAQADPRHLAEQAFGPSLSAPTRQAIDRAESPRQGLAILLMSPEMQRR